MTCEQATTDTDTYPTPEHGWVCFHCGESFPGNLAGSRDAHLHFGGSVDAIPGCRLRMRAGEKSLLRRVRWLEREVEKLRSSIANEDTQKDREFYAMIAKHREELIREEEKGYAKGVADARKETAA